MFQRLALTVQDSCEEVRERFVEKLSRYLMNFQIPLDYLSIMVYAGAEPCKSRRDKFHKLLSANVTKRKQCVHQLSKAKENPHAVLAEYAVSHAIYLVAHHPQFSRTSSHKLDKFKDSFSFFLEPMLNRGENYGFLRKLLETIKTTVDAQDPSNAEANKNLYAACDLAIGVMGAKHTHVALGDFSGRVILSSVLFKSRGKTEPNEVRYLPTEYSCIPTKHSKPHSPITSPNSTAAVAEVSVRAKIPPGTSFKASNNKKSSKTSRRPAKTASLPSRGSNTRSASAREGASKGQTAKKMAMLKKETAKQRKDSGEEESGVEGIETAPASSRRKRSGRGRAASATVRARNHVRNRGSQKRQVVEEEEEVSDVVKEEDREEDMKEDSIEEVKVPAPSRNTRHSKRHHKADELAHGKIDIDLTAAATKKIKLQATKPAIAKKTKPVPEAISSSSIKRRTRPRR